MVRQNTDRELPSGPGFSRLDRLYGSPGCLLAAIIGAAFVSEAIVMFSLDRFDLMQTPFHHVFDALLLVLLLFPVLYFLVFRSVKLHLARRQSVEDELAAERNKLRGILDTMPAGVCIVNQHFQIEYANSALEQEFGPVQGKFCYEYFHGQEHVCPACRLSEIRDGGSAVWEWQAEKTRRTYEIFDTPLRNADGSMVRLSLVWDITARKQADNELRISRERLRSLSDHLQRAREEERTAISREIHDELGQVLATMQLALSAMIQECPDHPPALAKAAELERLIAGGIQTVRDMSSRLRPAVLDDLGLAAAIEWQLQDFKRRSGIDCVHDLLLRENDLKGDLATALFRICQEALTNILLHAGANRVKVLLEERGTHILLLVKDDGCGITPEQLHDRRSLGLIGMRERAYMLGGRVKIRRCRAGGTLVLARLPNHNQQAREIETP